MATNHSPTLPGAEELPAILFVDDEQKTCKHFRRLFSDRFRIFVAYDGLEAMKIFREQHKDIGVIVTDQRMPNETGTDFLQKAALLKPSVIRILSTAYADVDAAVESVNKGGVYRYITKPWEVPELEVTLLRAMELYLLMAERDDLVRQKITSVESLASAERVHALAALSVFKDSSLRHVSRAISALVQLTGLSTDIGYARPSTGGSQQWEELYSSHRHFLELAYAALPDGLASRSDLDPNQAVDVSSIFAEVASNNSQFSLQPGTSSGQSWPGPPSTVKQLLEDLLKALSGTLAQTDQIGLLDDLSGPEIRLSSISLQHALRPLASNDMTSGEDATRCLDIAAAFISWFHHGGTMQIMPDQANGTVRLRLGFVNPGSQNDPWQSLAADLIGNDFFWQRHL
jgi:FixJ family two-component response regulator